MFRSREVKVFRFCSTAATKSLLVWIIFFAMETRKVNKFVRSFRPGVALDQAFFKRSIIDRIISDGGDRITGYIPRSFTQLADELRVSPNTVKSVWYKYCEEMQTLASRKEAQHLQNYRKRTLNSSKCWKSTPGYVPFRNHLRYTPTENLKTFTSRGQNMLVCSQKRCQFHYLTANVSLFKSDT